MTSTVTSAGPTTATQKRPGRVASGPGSVAHLTTQHAQSGRLPEGVEFCFTAPGDLLMDANVRSDLDMTEGFRASIRDLGVLTPIVAVRTGEGLRVQKGQRRTVAAVDAGLAGVPVYVVPAADDATRIIEQLAENHDRAAMTVTDDAAAYEQLALLGLSANQIAKRTRRTKAEVTAGLTVAKSTAARQAATEFALDLTEAATFAEFTDDENATTRLTEAASSGRSLAHTAQRIRDERAREAAIAAAKNVQTDAGVTLTRRPGYWDTNVRQVDALQAAGSREQMTIDAHATCPGHAAWIAYDEDTRTATPVFVCTDFKEHGHKRWNDPAKAVERTPLSEEERAERRTVRENNAAWRSAETVRRAWLPRLAARKTPPKGAAEFIAQALCHDTAKISDAAMKGMRLAAQLLGHKDPYGCSAHVTDQLAKANTARSQLIALVIVVAAIEESTGVHSWRRPSAASREAAYLTALASWGYELSDIETATTGQLTPEGQDDQDVDAA